MQSTTFAICAAVVCALLPQISSAADLSPIVNAPTPVPALGYTWTGCYVGVSGGDVPLTNEIVRAGINWHF